MPFPFSNEGSLRPRNVVFNQTRFCYELILDDTSVIEECEDDDVDIILPLQPRYTRIGRLLEIPSNSVVDVLGIVKTTAMPKDIVTKVLTAFNAVGD